MDLKGRVAIITGGNSGIEPDMAHGLAAAGALLVIARRNVQKNAATKQTLQALGVQVRAIQADDTQEAACRGLIERTREHFGRLDKLINNAGTNIRKPPHDFTLDEGKP